MIQNYGNYIYTAPNDFLAHHGIKGQKWGIRRYQNPDGTLTAEGRKRYLNEINKANASIDKSVGFNYRRSEQDLVGKTFPKGFEFKRVQSPGEKPQNGVYVYYKDNDVSNIRSIAPYLASKRGVNPTDLVETTFKTTEDIKVAPLSVTREVQKKLLSDETMRNKVATYEALRNFADSKELIENPKEWAVKAALRRNPDYTKEEAAKVAVEYLNIRKSYVDNALNRISSQNMDHFTKHAADFAVGGVEDYKVKFMEEMKKRGYNAVYDNAMIDAGTKAKTEAEETLIILDPKSLQTVNNKKLNNFDLIKAEYNYQKWASKIGG